MRRIRGGMTGLACVFLVAASAGGGENWPAFRGPTGQGVSDDKSVPLRWSQTENLAWTCPLPGPGSSSPVVWGGKVFITCYTGYGLDKRSPGRQSDLKRHLLCVDLASGKVIWTKTVKAELPEDNYRGYLTEHGYASGTPATDGQRVYVFYGKTGVLAYDMTGKELWRVGLGKMSSNRRWGSGASPVLHGNLLIVNAAEEARAIVALDKTTGKEVWKAAGDALELSFNTPRVVKWDGDRTDILLAAPGEVWGINPETGKLRWFVETKVSGNVTPSLVVDEKTAYLTGGYPRLGSAAIRLGGKGDATKTHLAWTASDASYVASPVLHEGRLYWVDDRGVAFCVDAATGKRVYRHRLDGIRGGGYSGRKFYASPVLAGGRLYAVSRRSGALVIDPKPTFKVLATNVIASDETDFNGSPAIVGGRMLLRSDKALYCVQAK